MGSTSIITKAYFMLHLLFAFYSYVIFEQPLAQEFPSGLIHVFIKFNSLIFASSLRLRETTSCIFIVGSKINVEWRHVEMGLNWIWNINEYKNMNRGPNTN